MEIQTIAMQYWIQEYKAKDSVQGSEGKQAKQNIRGRGENQTLHADSSPHGAELLIELGRQRIHDLVHPPVPIRHAHRPLELALL